MGSWSRVDDLIATLRSRWERGVYLRAYAEGQPWSPVSVPIKGPKGADLVSDLETSLQWLERFHIDSRRRGAGTRFAVEYRTVRSRALGDNQVPARIRLDSLEQLASLLGTSDEIVRLDGVLAATRRDAPDLVPWVIAHPTDAVTNHDTWDQLLRSVQWIVANDTSHSDVRHLDVPGVDTKFVERHRKILARLLDQVLPPERIDPESSGFTGRYGFRRRPGYTRFRLLTPVPTFPSAVTELELRTDELARVEVPVKTVFIVENKASYLAFPEVPDAIVIFGEGFGVTTLDRVSWLAERGLVYWGDIDTHGFAILHRLRERVPSVQSILMDRTTLLDHRDQIVVESNPTNVSLTCLTDEERDLYHDLVEDRYGPAVRLEQERIRFSFVRLALEPWTSPTPATGPSQ